jgi:2-polyprenyl-6-methoxyphenol hydroxylase-like FAD-dependent oxidoreductase
VANIIVLGGGVCGLAAAVLLARDGHDISVFERDRERTPEHVEGAWTTWERPGVVQFRQPHFLQARVRQVLHRELPDVCEALLRAGAAWVDPLDRLPPAITDRGSRPGDERFVSITARRTTTEHVVASIAENEPRVNVRRGVEVVGLTTKRNGTTPHVTGIRTAGGELSADLVVDAMGRNSKLPRWLNEAGTGRIHEEAEDSGFLYYTRFFRARGGSIPEPRTPFLVTPMGSISVLTLPSDRETWSVTIFASSGDQPIKRLRQNDTWTAVIGACPLHAHWLEGAPISDVLPMAGVLDRYRRLVADGKLVATGVALVADSWACTNPSLARGIALGLDHAARLRDVARAQLDEPREFSEAWDAVTEAEFTPWYRATVATDRARLAEMELTRSGADPPATDPDPAAAARARFAPAATRDPHVFRAFLEVVGCLTPPAEVLARPGLVERILEATDSGDLPRPPGPSRAELLQLLT